MRKYLILVVAIAIAVTNPTFAFEYNANTKTLNVENVNELIKVDRKIRSEVRTITGIDAPIATDHAQWGNIFNLFFQVEKVGTTNVPWASPSGYNYYRPHYALTVTNITSTILDEIPSYIENDCRRLFVTGSTITNTDWENIASVTTPVASVNFPNLERIYCPAITTLPSVTAGTNLFGQTSSPWLVKFSAPNISANVSEMVFWGCDNLDINDVKTTPADVAIVSNLTTDITNIANKTEIKRLVITGNPNLTGIQNLRTTLTALSEIELLNATSVTANLFYNSTTPNNWLVEFSAPKATIINANAFKGCSKLTTVNLPIAENIGNNAFENCVLLASIPTSVKTIGESAFKGCTGLTSLNVNATNIGNNAFENCTNASLTSVTLAEVTTIGKEVFKECTQITIISLPKVTTSGLNVEVFSGCTNLTTVTLGSDAIPDNMFKNNTKLTTITANNAVSVGSSSFEGCTALNSFTATKVETIGANAFKGCIGLTSIPASSSVKTIADNAFENCTNSSLTSITLNEVTTIGKEVFKGCTQITSISLPKLTTISANSLTGLTTLTTLELGTVALTDAILEPVKSTLTTLTSAATSVTATLSNSTTYSALKTLTLSGLTNIAAVVKGNTVLEKLTFAATTIPTDAFTGCSALKTIEYTGTTVSANAFENNTVLETIVLSNAITINESAFYGCSALKSVTATKVVTLANTTTDKGVFEKCDELVSISLPACINIGNRAFGNCAKLATIELLATGNMAIGDYAFGNTPVTTLKLGGAQVTPTPNAFTFIAGTGRTTASNSVALHLSSTEKPTSGSVWENLTWKSITEISN